MLRGPYKGRGRPHRADRSTGSTMHLTPINAIRAFYKEMMNPDPVKKPGPVKKFSKEEIDTLNQKLKTKDK